jgi:hypothetical protein
LDGRLGIVHYLFYTQARVYRKPAAWVRGARAQI